MFPLAFAPGFELGGAFALLLVFLGFVLLAAARALTLEEKSRFSASVVYLGLGLAAAGLFWTVAFAVMLSILLHGIGALAITRRLLGR